MEDSDSDSGAGFSDVSEAEVSEACVNKREARKPVSSPTVVVDNHIDFVQAGTLVNPPNSFLQDDIGGFSDVSEDERDIDNAGLVSSAAGQGRCKDDEDDDASSAFSDVSEVRLSPLRPQIKVKRKSNSTSTQAPTICSPASLNGGKCSETCGLGSSRQDREANNGHRHEGTLWKLNRAGDPMEDEDWLLRRMWIDASGILVYFSEKELKPLQLFSGNPVRCTKRRLLSPEESCRPYTIEFEIMEREDLDPTLLAAENVEELEEWMHALEGA